MWAYDPEFKKKNYLSNIFFYIHPKNIFFFIFLFGDSKEFHHLKYKMKE